MWCRSFGVLKPRMVSRKFSRALRNLALNKRVVLFTGGLSQTLLNDTRLKKYPTYKIIHFSPLYLCRWFSLAVCCCFSPDGMVNRVLQSNKFTIHISFTTHKRSHFSPNKWTTALDWKQGTDEPPIGTQRIVRSEQFLSYPKINVRIRFLQWQCLNHGSGWMTERNLSSGQMYTFCSTVLFSKSLFWSHCSPEHLNIHDTYLKTEALPCP